MQYHDTIYHWRLLSSAVIVVVLLVVWFARNARTFRAVRFDRMRDPQYRAWREDPLTPVQAPAGLSLEPGEAVYYSGAASVSGEQIDWTENVGSASPRMQLTLHVSLRSASAPASPASSSGGTLTLTNKRFVFTGDGKNIVQAYDVPGVTLVPNPLGIIVVPQQGGQGILFQTGDPIAGIVLLRAARNTLTQSVAPDATISSNPIAVVPGPKKTEA
jgi:hypothetical protein